jgi:hypothetical protein
MEFQCGNQDTIEGTDLPELLDKWKPEGYNVRYA